MAPLSTPSAPCRFQVGRRDLTRTRCVDDPHAPAARPLAEGEARLRIEQFALTANNVTYAAFGEAMHYWDFFPTGEEDWGCVPVWGFAEVVESRCAPVPVGLRVYGYLPMGSHLVVQPGRVRDRGFSDTTACRAALPAIYNDYLDVRQDPLHAEGREALQALLRPLFTTAFLLADQLAERQHHGAARLLLSSASSKTAWCTAVCLAAAGGGPERVGLTSRRHLPTVQAMGCYDRVLAYEDLQSLDPSVPSAYVDFAGDGALRRAVHVHLAEALRHDTVIGASHWQALEPRADPSMPGPRPEFFFAPEQGRRRAAPPPEGWGAPALEQAIAQAWGGLMARLAAAQPPWLVPVHTRGAEAMAAAFARLRDGGVDPREGLMLSPH